MNIEEQNHAFTEAIEYYNTKKTNFNQELLVELLREIQDIYQYIPISAQEEISQNFDIKLPVISSLIKRYPSLKQAPYRHKITICCGGSCFSKFGKPLLLVMEKELGIQNGEVTKNGRFLLTTQNCLKNCKSGPNMLIDNDIYSCLTPQSALKILERYK